MPDTGSLFPTAVTTINHSGSEDWIDSSNVLADDSLTALCTTADPAGSHYLQVSGFDASSIPSDRTLEGIEVLVDMFESGLGTLVVKAQLLDDTGTPVGSVKTVTQNGSSVAVFGGASDMWSTSLTRADVLSSSFGCRVWYEDDHDLDIDYIAIRFTYSASGGGGGGGGGIGTTSTPWIIVIG